MFNRETLKALTTLAQVRCSQEEEPILVSNLEKILHTMEAMSAVDTSHVEPCSQVIVFPDNVLREDTVEESLPRETFLANSASTIGGMVRVPLVFE